MSDPSVCTFPGCLDPAVAHGLCHGHYVQRKRGGELKPKRTKPGASSATRVQVVVPGELRTLAQAHADEVGETESEWWRKAGELRLERVRRGG